VAVAVVARSFFETMLKYGFGTVAGHPQLGTVGKPAFPRQAFEDTILRSELLAQFRAKDDSDQSFAGKGLA
jgi:hypothetical protein